MARMTFIKDAGSAVYEATFTVNGDWNMHIELPDGRKGVRVLQKDPDAEKYAFAWSSKEFDRLNESNVIDMDFSHGIVPKDIKVQTFVEPEEATYKEG